MKLEKKLLLLFLIANMTAEYTLFQSLSLALFYFVLFISISFWIKPEITSSAASARFPELRILIIVYLICQFVFQISFINVNDFLFTVSKCALFGIMMLSITKDFDFYFKKSLNSIGYVVLFLVALGWFVNKVNIVGSVTFGFINGNVTGTLATAGFAAFMFRKERPSKFDIICMVFLLATIIMGGCRNALVMVVLITLVRYGVSMQLIFVGLIGLVFVFWVMPSLGLEIKGVERIIGTINGTVEIDREAEQRAAWIMINEKPLTGWGHNYANSVAASQESAYNAHNGYLTLIENLGWPCGLSVILIILVGSIKRLKLFKEKNRYVNFHLAIMISVLFATGQEDYLNGVNQCTTNLFFLSFAVLGMYMYKQKKEKLKTI